MHSKNILKIILIVIVFSILISLYHNSYKQNHQDFLSRMKIADVPNSIKCAFNEPKCDEGNIDGWTLLFGMTYLFIGYLVPGYYLTVFFVSVLFEISQSYLGNGSRFIINPLVNLTAYSIGSIYSTKNINYAEKYKIVDTRL